MRYYAGVETSNEEGWLNLHRNENLFIEDTFLKNIVIDAVNASPISVMPDTNHTELKKKLAAFHNVTPDNIFIGNGADEVLSSLFYLFRKRNAVVNLPRVCFKMYNHFASKYGFEVNQYNNFPVIEEKEILKNSGFFVIDSPASITGEKTNKTVFDQLTADKSNWVIWDNVHGPFSDDTTPVFKENLIVVRHFTHFYGLAALRIGYCIASAEIVEELNVFREPFNVNGIALHAAVTCLDKHEYFASLAKEIMQHKTVFEQELKRLRFSISKSAVNFVFVKHEKVPSTHIYEQLADRKIAVRHYDNDDLLKDYLRIAVPTPENMGKVISSLREITEATNAYEQRNT